MNRYALTYPQLMAELMLLDLSPADLVACRDAYRLAARMTDGLYRPSGASFLGHLTRTASIASRIRPEAPMVAAALTHAAYSLGRIPGASGWLRWRAPRRALRAAVGAPVEAMVHAYDGLPWNTEAAVRAHIDGVDTYPDDKRRAVELRLANELEDHLDGGNAFLRDEVDPERRRCAASCPELAQRIGHPWLADQLGAALEAERELCPPAALRIDRQYAYRHGTEHMPELRGLRTLLRRLGARLRHGIPPHWPSR